MRRRRSVWTDERLDDLNRRVDKLNERMEAGFARVDAELRALNDRLFHGLIAMVATMLTGFLAIAGLILAHG
jgi:hypothetical protein